MRTSRLTFNALIAAGLLTAGALGAGALSATGALAASTSPTPAPSSSTTTPPGAPPGGFGGRHGGFGDGAKGFGGRGLGGGGFGGLRGSGGPLLHGEFVVGSADGKTTTTELVQHGGITAKTDGSVTVQSTDGFSVTWTLDAKTVIRTGWKSGSVKDLAVKDQVTVTGTKTATGGTAAMVGERPTGAPPADGNFGPRPGQDGTPAPAQSGAGSGA